MAKPLPTAVNAEHNLGARADVIRSTMKQLYDLDVGITAAREEHVKPLQKKRTKLFRERKSELDMTREQIDLEYRQYKMQRDIENLEEEADRADAFDNMRELHNALVEGQMLDWVTVETGDERGDPQEQAAD